jgi:putative PIN family toxin of toxin-antitoxin system
MDRLLEMGAGVFAIICRMTVIVVDTSVIVSALIGANGPGRQVLRACLQHQAQPLISNALFLEYEDVIGRPEIAARCPLTGEEVRKLLNAFYKTCNWVPIYFLWRPNVRDEGDNFLFELALAGNAEVIVTNNIRDLRNTELRFPVPRVLTPEQWLKGA